MKKYFKFLSIILIGVLLITGCGKEKEEEVPKKDTPEQVLAKIQHEMEKIDNGRQDMVMLMGMKSGDMSFEISMNFMTEFYGDTSYAKMTSSFMGQNIELDMYMVEGKDEITTYTKTDGKWTKTIEKQEDNESEFSKYFKDYKGIEEIQDENTGGGLTGYKITIPKETAMDILSQNGEEMADTIEITGDMIIKMYVNKNNQVEKMIFDFNNTFKSKEAEIEITKLIMTIDYKDYGLINKITIPDAALKAPLSDTASTGTSF